MGNNKKNACGHGVGVEATEKTCGNGDGFRQQENACATGRILRNTTNVCGHGDGFWETQKTLAATGKGLYTLAATGMNIRQQKQLW